MANNKKIDPIGWDNARPVEGKGFSRAGAAGFPSLSIISAGKNGKRTKLSNEMMTGLLNPEKVQFALVEGGVLIGTNQPGNNKFFKISTTNNKANIYNAGLVAEIISAFKLDFTNCTSKSFSDVTFFEVDNAPVAYVKIEDYECKKDKADIGTEAM